MSRYFDRVVSMSVRPANLSNKPPQTIEKEKQITVVDGLEATVFAEPATTVVGESGGAIAIWKADLNESLFPGSRVRQVQRAQDALTHVEESVYDCLWGQKNTAKDEFRLTQLGYDRISKAARVTKRNAALIIERLIEKGFVQLDTPADTNHRIPARYKVLGYRSALQELQRMGRKWVVRSGNGLLFVRPVTVVINPATTVVSTPALTVVADNITTVVVPTTVPVVTDVPTTVVAATTVLDSNKEKTYRHPSSSSLVEEAARKCGVVLDDDAVRRLARRCKENEPLATDEEIAYMLDIKFNQHRRDGSVRNLPGMLIKSVSELFPSNELSRFRAQKRRERAEAVEVAQKVIDDPESSESDREWAGKLLLETA